MGIRVDIDGVSRIIPQAGDSEWGEMTTEFLMTLVLALEKRVGKTSNETIEGKKIFATAPIVPRTLNFDEAARKEDIDILKNSLESLENLVMNNTERANAIFPIDGSKEFE